MTLSQRFLSLIAATITVSVVLMPVAAQAAQIIC
jgi:hypothetical protein